VWAEQFGLFDLPDWPLVEPRYNLAPTQNVAAMRIRADSDRRELAQMRNRLEGMLSSNERVLAEFSSALAPDERERIEETLLRSREIASSESRDELNEALFDMQGVSKVLTRVILQRAAAGSGEAAAPGS